MSLYEVSFNSNIIGGSDHTFVLAKNEEEAFKIGKPLLNNHKLTPDFANHYGRYAVIKVT